MDAQPARQPADSGQDVVCDRAGGCDVDLLDATGRLTGVDGAWLIEHVTRAARVLPAPGGEARIKVIDDAAMDAAHRAYSGVAGTTDVLTFDLAQGASAAGAPLDVDILVCLDEAERQARARGHEARRELLLYVLHGMLHALGEDDHDDARYARMHAREDAVLRAIGVGETFASDKGACA